MTEATETAVAEIGAILSEEIANLGYPVGMGLAPSPEFIERVEQRIVRTCATALANRRTDTAVVGEEALLAGCRVMNPNIFARGLDPLPGDGPATRARIKETRDLVASILEATRSPTGGREAGLEEAARWHDEQIEVVRAMLPPPGEPDEAGTYGDLVRVIGVHSQSAHAIRALLPSEQKARS